MKELSVAERRARLAVRHHLAGEARASTVVDATASIVALHSTDPASVFLSLHARVDGVTPEDIENALYEQRAILRMLGMRRTMFVVPTELAPVVQAAATNAIAERQRARYAQLVEAAGVGDAAFLADVAEETAAALATRGEATGAQLSADVPRLRTPIALNEGKAYGRTQNLTTWVLFQLAADGRIVRGRPLGTWTSSQYRWSPVQAWLPEGIEPLPAATARAELVRRWLAAYGPATMADLRVVDRLDRQARQGGAGGRRRHRGGAGRDPARRRCPHPGAGTMGRPAARAGPDAHGLVGARLVRRAVRRGAL